MHLTAGSRGVSPARLALSPLPSPRASPSPDSRSLEKSRFLRPCPPSRPPPPSSASSSNCAQRGGEAPSARGAPHRDRDRAPHPLPAPLPPGPVPAHRRVLLLVSHGRPPPPRNASARPAPPPAAISRRGGEGERDSNSTLYTTGPCAYRDLILKSSRGLDFIYLSYLPQGH